MICLEYMYKSYTFASAFENESSDQMTFWLKGESLVFVWLFFWMVSQNKSKKTSEKIWKIFDKVLIFATAFQKKAEQNKTRVLWEIYINNT